MSEIDQQFIEYVVKSLVGKPGAVEIKRTIDEKGVLLELTVDPEDLGRVIGKRGATAQSLRTLLRALGTKNDARYNLKIVDNGVGAPEKSAESAEDAPVKKQSKTKEDKKAPVDDESADTAEPAEPEAAADEESTETDESTQDEDGTTDRLARARKELADLDDLDV